MISNSLEDSLPKVCSMAIGCQPFSFFCLNNVTTQVFCNTMHFAFPSFKIGSNQITESLFSQTPHNAGTKVFWAILLPLQKHFRPGRQLHQHLYVI